MFWRCWAAWRVRLEPSPGNRCCQFVAQRHCWRGCVAFPWLCCRWRSHWQLPLLLLSLWRPHSLARRWYFESMCTKRASHSNVSKWCWRSSCSICSCYCCPHRRFGCCCRRLRRSIIYCLRCAFRLLPRALSRPSLLWRCVGLTGGINRGEVCGCKGCSLSFVTVVSFTIHALDCCVLISVFAVSDIVIVSSQSQLLILDCHSILLMLAFSLSLFLLVG